LVSGHKTGYQVAYLSRNWSPYFIFAMAPCCIKCISYAPLDVVASVHYIAGRSNANMSWIFLEIPPVVSWKSPGNLFG